jgi:hypothetical protein
MALPNFRSSPCVQHARNPAMRINPACKGFTIDQRYPGWHSYLAELTMEVCCEIARQGPDAEELYARARDRSGCGEWFYSCFEAGFFAVGNDPIRLYRYIELVLTFTSQIERMKMRKNISDDCLNRIDDLRRKCGVRIRKIVKLGGLDSEVETYAKSVCRAQDHS